MFLLKKHVIYAKFKVGIDIKKYGQHNVMHFHAVCGKIKGGYIIIYTKEEDKIMEEDIANVEGEKLNVKELVELKIKIDELKTKIDKLLADYEETINS